MTTAGFGSFFATYNPACCRQRPNVRVIEGDASGAGSSLLWFGRAAAPVSAQLEEIRHLPSRQPDPRREPAWQRVAAVTRLFSNSAAAAARGQCPSPSRRRLSHRSGRGVNSSDRDCRPSLFSQ